MAGHRAYQSPFVKRTLGGNGILSERKRKPTQPVEC